MSAERWENGVLREKWDDDARLYTSWDAEGLQTDNRVYTAEENARADETALTTAAGVNATTLRTQALAAMQTNRDFLALASPTNAQTLAQVKALTRQMNGAARLLLGRLEGTD